MNTLSIIIPCFNEELNIIPFYERTIKVVKSMKESIANYEFIFIDDGSKDSTVSNINKLAKMDTNVKFISFSRNFGKEAAMLAGITHSQGDFVAILDVDMQDPPELMIKMMNLLKENKQYECVATRRVNRKGEPPIRSFFSNLFYNLINKISDVKIVNGARDYRIMTRKMVDSLLLLKEKNRFSKGLFSWAGYNTYYLEYENEQRAYGETKWSFWKLFKYSIDGIISFSIAPLQIASIIGLLLCITSLCTAAYFFIAKLTVGIAVEGYAFMICAIFLLGGMQLLGIGILGQYLGKIFIECKNRPDYIVIDSNLESNLIKEGKNK